LRVSRLECHHLVALQVAVRTRTLAPTQLLSVLHTLEWALMVTTQDWQSLLLTRADLELKADIRLPPPTAHTCDLITPFETLDGWLVADTIVYLPWCRYDEMLSTLNRRARKRNESHDFHGLCHWMDGVKFFHEERYDANSNHDWNPMYRMVGRPEVSRAFIPEQLKRQHVVRRPRASHRFCHTQAPGACLSGCSRSKEPLRRALVADPAFNLSLRWPPNTPFNLTEWRLSHGHGASAAARLAAVGAI